MRDCAGTRMMRRILFPFFVAFSVVVLDQLTKAWILYDLMNPPRVIEILPFIDIVLVWNKGIGFGLLQAGSPWGMISLIVLALGICFALGGWIWKTTDKFLVVCLSMIIGGAIGNVIDRLRFGAVVDFIYVHVYILGYRFPAFNVADSAITIGVCLLLIESYVRKKQ